MTPITESHFKLAPNLKAVIQFGVGLEGVDITAARTRNIQVSNIKYAQITSFLKNFKVPFTTFESHLLRLFRSADCGNAQACAGTSYVLQFMN